MAWTVQRGRYFTDEPLFLEGCLAMRKGRTRDGSGYLILTGRPQLKRERPVNLPEQHSQASAQSSDVPIRCTHARSDSMVTG